MEILIHFPPEFWEVERAQTGIFRPGTGKRDVTRRAVDSQRELFFCFRRSPQ